MVLSMSSAIRLVLVALTQSLLFSKNLMWLFTPQAGIANPANLDQGLQFRDGIFETMLTHKMAAWFQLPAILQRQIKHFALSTTRVRISETKLQGAISALLQQAAGLQNGIVKLIYTQGGRARIFAHKCRALLVYHPECFNCSSSPSGIKYCDS